MLHCVDIVSCFYFVGRILASLLLQSHQFALLSLRFQEEIRISQLLFVSGELISLLLQSVSQYPLASLNDYYDYLWDNFFKESYLEYFFSKGFLQMRLQDLKILFH